MKRLFVICFITLLSFSTSFSKGASNTLSRNKTNVLIIAVDNLRLQVGIYGQSQMITPSLYKLGKEGLVFSKDYCSAPVYSASCASLLSGLRPTPARFVNSTYIINKQCYLFYHNCILSEGVTHLQIVKCAELKHWEDDSIETLNPFKN